MIITFFGHSNCLFNDDIKKQLKTILGNEIIKNPTCKFYLGGYGDFDGLCLRTLRELKHDKLYVASNKRYIIKTRL